MQNSCRKNSEETCTFWKKKKKKDVCNSHLFHSTEYNAGHEVINSKKSEQKKIGVFIFFLLLWLNRISELGNKNEIIQKKMQLQFFSSSDSMYACLLSLWAEDCWRGIFLLLYLLVVLRYLSSSRPEGNLTDSILFDLIRFDISFGQEKTESILFGSTSCLTFHEMPINWSI